MDKEIALPKIYVDFNNTDEKGRIRLITQGALADIQRLNSELKEGLLINIYQDDLSVVARVELSSEERIWVAIADWSTRKSL